MTGGIHYLGAAKETEFDADAGGTVIAFAYATQQLRHSHTLLYLLLRWIDVLKLRH